MATPKQEAMMRELAEYLEITIETMYGKRMGFFLTVFEFHKPGVSDFISNAEREGIIESMKETASRFEKGEIIPATKGKA